LKKYIVALLFIPLIAKAFFPLGLPTIVKNFWTPAAISTLAWYDASDTSATNIIESGGAVSEIKDKSGSDFHMTQGTGANQPITETRTIGGLNVLDFDGTDRLFTSTVSLIPSSGDAAFFMVAMVDATGGSNDSIYSIQGTNDFQMNANSTTQFEGEINQSNIGAADPAYDNYPYDGPAIFSSTFDFASDTVFFGHADGVLRTVEQAYTAKLSESQDMRIFASRGLGSIPTGAFGEYIIVEDITPEKRQLIEGYLGCKWSLNYKLPESHPYKYDGTLFGCPDLWSPADITTELWMDAMDANTLTFVNTISDWADKSGNNRDFTQAIGGNQPTYTYNSIPGKWTANFDGVDTMNDVTTATFINSTAYTVYSVVKSDVTTGTNYFFGTRDSFLNRGLHFGHPSSSNLFSHAHYSDDHDYVMTRSTNAFLTVNTFHNTGSSMFLNGTSVGDSTIPDTALSTTGGMNLGAGHSDGSNKWDGDIGEIVITTTTPSSETRILMEGYLSHKWGLEANLPSDHPYKDSPPTK